MHYGAVSKSLSDQQICDIAGTWILFIVGILGFPSIVLVDLVVGRYADKILADFEKCDWACENWAYLHEIQMLIK